MKNYQIQFNQLLDQIHDEMYAKALKFRDENIKTRKHMMNLKKS